MYTNAQKAGFFITGIVLLALAALLGKAALSYFHDETVTCTVTGKDRVWKSNSDGGGRSEMRVYTSDCGTMVVADSLIKGQFNSADTFGQLQPGHRYTLTRHGWRIGFLSAFPTITEATEVRL